jgi:hypothetical protein
MPYGYQLQSHTLALAPVTTSGTTNTEVDHLFIKPGAGAKVAINGLRLQGQGNALTTLNGLSANWKNWTTGSTAGTAMTPRPVSVSGNLAAAATAGGAPTAGTGGGTYKGGFGCSGSGPSFWTAQTPDQMIDMAAGYAGSMDLYSVAVALSLAFHWWVDFLE